MVGRAGLRGAAALRRNSDQAGGEGLWYAARLLRWADMESVRKALWFIESRFSDEAPVGELSVAAGISRCRFALDATIRAWRKRTFKLIREMLAVERRRQPDDVEKRLNAGVPENPIEVYSPIFRWLCGRD
jgi:hypothetical protein